jgi:hypothetical protein
MVKLLKILQLIMKKVLLIQQVMIEHDELAFNFRQKSIKNREQCLCLIFALHANNPQKYRVPSEVILIISGSTSYQNKLFIDAQFDKDVLLCQDLF